MAKESLIVVVDTDNTFDDFETKFFNELDLVIQEIVEYVDNNIDNYSERGV